MKKKTKLILLSWSQSTFHSLTNRRIYLIYRYTHIYTNRRNNKIIKTITKNGVSCVVFAYEMFNCNIESQKKRIAKSIHYLMRRSESIVE